MLAYLVWISNAEYWAKNECRNIFCTFCAKRRNFLSADNENLAGARGFCVRIKKGKLLLKIVSKEPLFLLISWKSKWQAELLTKAELNNGKNRAF